MAILLLSLALSQSLLCHHHHRCRFSVLYKTLRARDAVYQFLALAIINELLLFFTVNPVGNLISRQRKQKESERELYGSGGTSLARECECVCVCVCVCIIRWWGGEGAQHNCSFASFSYVYMEINFYSLTRLCH